MGESCEETTVRSDALPTDLVCDLLGHEERRRLLLVLRDIDEPTETGQLARLVAAEMPSTDRDAVESLCTRLHHIHLPKLAAAEMITRGDNQTVQLTECGDTFVAALVESPRSQLR